LGVVASGIGIRLALYEIGGLMATGVGTIIGGIALTALTVNHFLKCEFDEWEKELIKNEEKDY